MMEPGLEADAASEPAQAEPAAEKKSAKAKKTPKTPEAEAETPAPAAKENA
jgi:hypothetical protein